MKVDGLTNDEVKSHLQVGKFLGQFTFTHFLAPFLFFVLVLCQNYEIENYDSLV